jgi:hypothetical protein
MKATKYIAIALGLIAIMLGASWFLRNTIIERISNSILAQFDVTVTDVSLDALATSSASMSYLVLEHANGTIITIDDLTLPIRTALTGARIYSAGRVTIDLPAGEDDAPVNLADVFTQLLGLPLQLPQTEIFVAEVSVSPYRVIRDLQWQLMDGNQQLSAIVNSVLLKVIANRTSDTNHILNVSVTDSRATVPEHSVTVDIRQTDSGIALQSATTIDLSRWMPVSSWLGIDAVNVESGSATLQINGEIASDPDSVPPVSINLTQVTPVQLTYLRSADAVTSITVESASTIQINASLSDLYWDLRQAQATLLVSDGDLNDIPVHLVNLACESGTTCSAGVDIVMENAALPFIDIGRLEFSATQDVKFGDDGIQVLVRPNSSLSMSGVSNPDFGLARFNLQLTSVARLNVGDTAWQFTAQSADASIERYSVLDDFEFSAQVFLDDISFSDEARQPSIKFGAYASSSQAHWGEQVIRLPGFKGGIAREREEVVVFLETDGLYDEGSIEASHNLDSETGRLSLTSAGLSFDSLELSGRVSPWLYDWNISAGTFGIDLQADWQRRDTAWQVNAQTAVQATNLAGSRDDTVFTGLSTRIDAAFNSTGGFTVQPSTVGVALIDMGLPVENITADYTLRPDELTIDVANLRMTAFGGVVTADPFSFSTANERNTLHIQASSIDLAEVLSIREFEAVEVSGKIGAEFPVIIDGQTVTVEGGTLTGEAPGGVIRYLPGIGADETDASMIGIATRALSNFEYETLTSKVDYSTNGDLILQMRLTGRNPDLESNRPVILNFGLENNIPQMLKSLQAARSVEEILERRLAQ